MKSNILSSVLKFISIIFIVSLFSFQSNNDLSKEQNFIEAIAQKKITTELKSNGTYHGESVLIELKNLTSKELKLTIPAGTLFEPSNEKEQTLITVDDQFVTLPPKIKMNKVLEAFCCQATDACPKNTSTFAINKNKDEKFETLFTFMKGKHFSKSNYQSIVWAISNNHSVSSIPDDTKDNQELRKLLCKLTNQIDTWYNSVHKRTVNEKGIINSETVSVGGKYKFVCPKNTIIHQEIHKEGGGVMLRDEKRRTVSDGEIEYSFNIRVKGWQKGKYILKIMTNTSVIEEYEFII